MITWTDIFEGSSFLGYPQLRNVLSVYIEVAVEIRGAVIISSVVIGVVWNRLWGID